MTMELSRFRLDRFGAAARSQSDRISRGRVIGASLLYQQSEGNPLFMATPLDQMTERVPDRSRQWKRATHSLIIKAPGDSGIVQGCKKRETRKPPLAIHG